MGGIISSGLGAASLACQSAICCCNFANCMMTAGTGAGGVSARAAKIYYIVLLGLSTLLAIILRFNGDKLNINLGAWEVHCSDTHDLNDIGPALGGYKALGEEHYVYCKGDAAVFRISFVLSCFFLFMTVSSFTGRGFHRGFWGIKLVAVFFGLLASFFMSNAWFDNSGFAWVARIVSMIFLCLQILILIDFAYQWNDSWVSKAFPGDGEDDNSWLIAILASASLLYLVTLVGIPLLFTFYGECGLGVGFSSVTLVGVVVLTGLTLFRDKIVGEDHEGAILPAAVVSAYATYLCWSALQSNPDTQCKPETTDASNNIEMTIGILVAVVSLCWTSLSVTDGMQSLVTGGDADASTSASTPLYTVQGADGSETRAQPDSFESAGDEDYEEKSLWIFHLIMLTASMYMAMLVTDWGSDEAAHGNEDGTVGLASAWVKIVSQWLTILLYIWTLVAPRVLGEYRDFDF